MTYNVFAVSNNQLNEVQLYDFNLGTAHWRYTSADRDIDFDGHTYTAIAISDGGVKTTGQADETDNFTVTLPAAEPPHQLFRGTPPSEEVWLTVRRMQRGDSEAPIFFLGTILNSTQKDEITSEMVVRTIAPTLRRGGLRCLWGKSCPHMLYGPDCKVPKADYAVPATIDSLTATTLTSSEIAGKPVGWFDGGFLEWDRGGGATDRRAIHAGGTADTVNLLTSTDGLTVGDSVILYPGCDLTNGAGGCAKFNNQANNGGFPHMTEKNPFDGHPIF
jgi:uncharacterized phage protein (TIGR02218 family)